MFLTSAAVEVSSENYRSKECELVSDEEYRQLQQFSGFWENRFIILRILQRYAQMPFLRRRKSRKEKICHI